MARSDHDFYEKYYDLVDRAKVEKRLVEREIKALEKILTSQFTSEKK